MRTILRLAATLGVLTLPATAPAKPERAAPAPTATLDSGKISGVTKDGVAVFLGIPYAAPPVGPLRWKAPQPAAPWPGIRPANTVGAACIQFKKSDASWAQVGPQSEDCLFLNLWKPAHAGTRPLPVMLFIHGGSFILGSGGVPLYDGASLARRGAIVITINYRLGRLGFFAHPALTREDPKGLLGNFALMDQIAALRWVQRNAAQFGGDPHNVTIFGESAGAVSVQALVASPEARGLFAKAISQSGGGLSVVPPIRGSAGSAETAGETWAKSIGLDDPTPEQLRAVPLDKLLAAAGPAGAMIDGRILTGSPGDAFRRGTAARVPMILGGNSYEASLVQITPAFAKMTLGAAYPGLLAAYEKNPSRAGAEPDLRTQALFIQPTRWLATLQAKRGATSYSYFFTQVPASERTTSPGAIHGGELAYLFGTRVANETWDDADRKVSKLMGDYWVQFAKTGNPNVAGAPAWGAITPTAAPYLYVDAAPHTMQPSALEEEVQRAGIATATMIWGPLP